MQGVLSQWWRLGGALGIIFIIVFIIGGFLLQGEPPNYDDPIDDIRAFWEEDGESYLLGDYIIGLGVFLLFLPFLCALRALLGLYEGGVQIWSRLSLVGGILFIALTGVAASSWGALAFGAEQLDDESIRLLMLLDVYAWSSVPFGIAVLTLASAVVIFQTGVLWRWLAIIGVIVGVAALISPLGVLDDDPEDIFDLFGFLAFIGFAVWLLITSIGMVMKQEVVVRGPWTGDAVGRDPALDA